MEIRTDPGYFDYAATHPPWTVSLDAFKVVSEKFFGNPSSRHQFGKEAQQEILHLKSSLAKQLNFFDGRVLICSSGSEANNTVLEGHLRRNPGGRILIAEDVHESIWYLTREFPGSTSILRINSDGTISSSDLERSLQGISMFCVSHACHETGIIHPIDVFSDICRANGVRIMVDGMQAIGHIPVNLDQISFDYYTFTGHKFGAPKSMAGIFMREASFEPLIRGGSQQWGLRAGTESLAAVAALHEALKCSLDAMDHELVRLKKINAMIVSRLGSIPGIKTNSIKEGLPGLVSISIDGKSGSEIVSLLSMKGFAISTGSACHENHLKPSRIMLAMGYSESEANGTLRISMGIGTTEESANDLVDNLLDIIQNL